MAAKHSTFTPQDYVQYLTERGKEDPQALKGRQHFLNLSDENQQNFIDYMCDPKIIKEIFNTPVPENSKKVLLNGDIVLEHKTETELISETEVVNETKDNKILPSITALFYGSCFAAPKAQPIKTFRLTDVRTITRKPPVQRVVLHCPYKGTITSRALRLSFTASHFYKYLLIIFKSIYFYLVSNILPNLRFISSHSVNIVPFGPKVSISPFPIAPMPIKYH